MHSAHNVGEIHERGLDPPGPIYMLSIRPFSCVVPLKLGRGRVGSIYLPSRQLTGSRQQLPSRQLTVGNCPPPGDSSSLHLAKHAPVKIVLNNAIKFKGCRCRNCRGWNCPRAPPPGDCSSLRLLLMFYKQVPVNQSNGFKCKRCRLQ